MIRTVPLTLSDDAVAGRRIGLSLSGGGFRASLFHIGVLARLAELDLLRRVDILSCVSGGSIIGALYYLYLKRELDAHGEVDTPRLIELIAEMEHHFLSVVQKNLRWRVFSNLVSNFRLAHDDYSRTDRLGALFDRHLYQPVWGGDRRRPVEMRTLDIHPRGQRDFNPVTDNAARHCKVPVLMINATTLNTGHNWRFGTDRMGEPARAAPAQQVDRNWRLGQSRYNGLVHDYADISLGQVVAASAATPGLFEPYPLSRLYPHPERPQRHLQTALVDGSIYDNLGTEVLRERGCTHFLVSDASSQLPDDPEPDTRIGPTIRRSRDILLNRLRGLQLARLMDRQPNNVVHMHMMREVGALELQPVGPADYGHVVKDRDDTEITSYGIERQAQKLLAGMRTDLDGFSDIEALALMADGYLMTRRAFEGLEHQGAAWTEGPAYTSRGWRFTALFEALRQPSPGLLKHLNVARHRFFKGQRLVPRLRFEAGLLVFAALLGGSAMLTALTSDRIAIDPTILMAVILGLALIILAYPAYQALKSISNGIGAFTWLKMPLGIIGRAATIGMAAPLCAVSSFHLYAGRLFLKAGELPRIGIEPMPQMVSPKAREGAEAAAGRGAKKAA